MDNENAQAEAAPIETATASAAPASTPAETNSNSQPEASTDPNDALRAFYDKPVAERTEASAQPPASDEKPPAAESAKAEDGKAPEVKTPAEDDQKTTDAPEQMRPRLHDPQDIAVAALAKAKGITLVKAAAIIAAADAPPATPSQETTQQPSPLQAQEAKVADLQRQLEEAEGSDNTLTTAYQKLSRQFLQESGRLDSMRADAERVTHTRQQKEAQTQANRARQESEARVMAEYADAANPATALGKAYQEVTDEWLAAADKNLRIDAVLRADTAPERILDEAARRVAKQPSRYQATAAAPAKTPAASPAPQPAARRVTPAPGSKGQVTTGQPTTFGEVFAGVETAEQGNDALLRMYGGPGEGRRRGS